VAAVIWGTFHRYHELRHAKHHSDPELDAPRFLNWPADILFALKLAATACAYVLILSYISRLWLPPKSNQVKIFTLTLSGPGDTAKTIVFLTLACRIVKKMWTAFRHRSNQQCLTTAVRCPTSNLTREFNPMSFMVNPDRILTTGMMPLAISPKETDHKHTLPRPTRAEFGNRQLNLFQNLLCNTP
jgi:hypothetical protein